MGNWTLYSVGDAAFLEQILLSVAMLTGTNDFTRAASIGLLVALIIIGFQSLMGGGKELNVHQAFVGWIAFSILFVPTTTVVIEDNVSGSVRVVDNVPFGVGAAGGIISTVGYKLTAMYEQGYGYIAPYITETHFADSLNLLNRLRSAATDPKLLLAIGEQQGGDIRGSWDNYIRECTLTKIDLGEASVDDVMGGKLPEALLFPSTLFGTQIHVDHRGPIDATCYEAYWQLEAATRGGMDGYYFDNALSQALKISNPENPAHQSAYTEVSTALQALRFTQNNAQDFVFASILMPVYEQAVEGKYQDMQDYSSAIMVNQAIQQRNTQWAAEQSMFMSVVRPLQTFFEGFIYAITPLLAVLMIMGNFGLMLIFKYLQTIFWIQLWLPLLSIVNLYISTAAAGEMSVYDIPGQGVSMYSLAGVNDVLQTWIATGGMLAASIPVISLFVVTGSTYAMTSIAGKIGGADHINERIVTPDAVNPAPYMQQHASQTNSPLTGTYATGGEELVGNATLGSTISSGIKSAADRQQAATQNFGQEFGRALSSTTSSQQTGSVMRQIGSNIQSVGTQQTNMLSRLADQYSKQNGWSSEQRNEFLGALSAGLATGASGAGQGANGSVSFGASGQAIDRSSVASSAQEAFKKIQELGWSDQDTQQLTEQLATGLTSQSGQTWAHGLGDDSIRSLKESANEVVSASQSYSKFAEKRESLGSNYDMSLKTVGALMANQTTPEAKEALGQLNGFFNSGLADSGIQAQAQTRENLHREMGMDPRQAQIVGRLEAMSNASNPDNPTIAPQAAAGIVAQAVGLNAPSANPAANADMTGPSFQRGSVRGAVQGATAPARGLMVGDHFMAAGRAYSDPYARFEEHSNMPHNQAGEEMVRSHHQSGTAAIDQKANESMEASRQGLLSDVTDRIRRGDSTNDMSEWSKFMGVNSNYTNFFKNQVADIAGAVSSKLWDGDFSGDLVGDVENRQNQRIENLGSRVQADTGLTAAQAGLFATLVSGAGGSTGSSERGMEAYNAVIAEDPENGAYIARNIKEAVQAGATQGQAYLADVALYNQIKDPVNVREGANSMTPAQAQHISQPVVEPAKPVESHGASSPMVNIPNATSEPLPTHGKGEPNAGPPAQAQHMTQPVVEPAKSVESHGASSSTVSIPNTTSEPMPTHGKGEPNAVTPAQAQHMAQPVVEPTKPVESHGASSSTVSIPNATSEPLPTHGKGEPNAVTPAQAQHMAQTVVEPTKPVESYGTTVRQMGMDNEVGGTSFEPMAESVMMNDPILSEPIVVRPTEREAIGGGTSGAIGSAVIGGNPEPVATASASPELPFFTSPPATKVVYSDMPKPDPDKDSTEEQANSRTADAATKTLR
ncbi:conjugal transfer protein TraG N-terminal domain-containing protein [Alcaligenes faecalis]|uniref:conjugal transfer protein TraG N-terminal domain-containing protein n=1 Tax=Alcaligenes faecalis TaxID=511 RepID=UPI000A2D283C|nr:conjugal transfer protein TraG N-terminal domain-containing protein [Alcaligenes faecalis]OSZ41166.1 hypothetical protein BVZ29_13395 [Alcaligenes faecalis]